MIFMEYGDNEKLEFAEKAARDRSTITYADGRTEVSTDLELIRSLVK